MTEHDSRPLWPDRPVPAKAIFGSYFGRRGYWLLLAAAMGGLTCLVGPACAEAEEAARSLDPHLFGLQIPAGPIADHAPRKVLVADLDGDAVVAQVRVQVDDFRIVLLPDGTLAARAVRDTTETDRAFEPLSKDALAKRLTSSLQNGFRTKQTVRYLYVYDCSDLFAEATSRILETMFSRRRRLHAGAEARRPAARDAVGSHHLPDGGRVSALPPDAGGRRGLL